MRVIICSLVST